MTGALGPEFDAAAPTIRRVGPGAPAGVDGASAPMAADSTFGVALVTLWHEVAQAGGVVGFADSVDRAEIARAATPVVEDLRKGRALGVAADHGRRLVGVAVLRPGAGTRVHTGRIDLLMVEPALTGCGLGSGLLTALLDAARGRGLARVGVEFGQDERVQRFFERSGFTVWGRRPGWHRTGAGVDREEIIMGVQL
ncbi:MAG TPA: GNAT family N-acetyltransferase [Nakamurella sp.]